MGKPQTGSDAISPDAALSSTRFGSAAAQGAREVLLIGFPGLLAKMYLDRLLANEPESRCHVLVSDRDQEKAKKLLQSYGSAYRERLEIHAGEVETMHLGLGADWIERLTSQVTHVAHLHGVADPHLQEAELYKTMVAGTRNMLDFAKQAKRLAGCSFLSTAFVSGLREGVIYEDELDVGQDFRNAFESGFFKAEKLVRASAHEIKVCVFRPSMVIPDCRSDDTDNEQDLLRLGAVVRLLSRRMPLLLPAGAVAPLHVVPAHYAADAIYALDLLPEAQGRTFHLVDPHPLSGARFLDALAVCSGLPAPRIVNIPSALVRGVLKLAGTTGLSMGMSLSLAYFHTLSMYDFSQTRRFLQDTNIACPPVDSYLKRSLQPGQS